MGVSLFVILAKSAMISGITFLRVIALLVKNNKTVLFPLQESFSSNDGLKLSHPITKDRINFLFFYSKFWKFYHFSPTSTLTLELSCFAYRYLSHIIINYWFSKRNALLPYNKYVIWQKEVVICHIKNCIIRWSKVQFICYITFLNGMKT